MWISFVQRATLRPGPVSGTALTDDQTSGNTNKASNRTLNGQVQIKRAKCAKATNTHSLREEELARIMARKKRAHSSNDMCVRSRIRMAAS